MNSRIVYGRKRSIRSTDDDGTSQDTDASKSPTYSRKRAKVGPTTPNSERTTRTSPRKTKQSGGSQTPAKTATVIPYGGLLTGQDKPDNAATRRSVAGKSEVITASAMKAQDAKVRELEVSRSSSQGLTSEKVPSRKATPISSPSKHSKHSRSQSAETKKGPTKKGVHKFEVETSSPAQPPTANSSARGPTTATPSFERLESIRPQTPHSTQRTKPHITYISRTPTKPGFLEPAPEFPPSSPSTSLNMLEAPRQDRTPIGSPSKPARDLSLLFDFPPPLSKNTGKARDVDSAPGLPKTKRMLSRTGSTASSFGSLSLSQSHSRASLSSSSSGSSFARPSTTSSLRRLDTVPDIAFDEPSQARASSSSTRSFDSPPKRTSSTSTGEPMRPPLVPATSTTSSGSVRRTYAGASRSFLVALPTSHLPPGVGLPDTLEEQLEDDARESYTTLRARYGVDESSDPLHPDADDEFVDARTGASAGKSRVRAPNLPNGMMNDLRSITEMRSKGESRRFMDEVGYLLEGLGPETALGVRRGSALEVVAKLGSGYAEGGGGFWKKAKAAGLLGQMWEALRGDGSGSGDKVMDTAVASFASLASRDPQDLLDLASVEETSSTLLAILEASERKRDPLGLVGTEGGDEALKRMGVGKSEKMMLLTLRSIFVDKADLFPYDVPISTRLLVSSALSALPPAYFTLNNVSIIYGSALSELARVPPRVEAYASGLPILPLYTTVDEGDHDADLPSIMHIEHCLRVLDAFLLGLCADEEEEEGVRAPGGLRDRMWEDREAFGEGLITLTVMASVMLRDVQYEDSWDIASKCVESVYRVLVNLTSDSADWARTLLIHDSTLPAILSLMLSSHRQWMREQIKKEEQTSESLTDVDMAGTTDDSARARSMDHLCFALGLLTNLVQSVEEAKDAVRETLLDPNCPRNRRCIQRCRCPSRANGLQSVVRVYIDLGKPSGSEAVTASETPFLQGHLAVLVGLLVTRSPENQAIVLEALPGAHRRAKLEGLINRSKEFEGMFVDVAKRLGRAGAAVRGVGEDGEGTEGDDSDDEEGEGIPRLQRDSGGAERSVEVTREVIATLEKLRDGRL